MDLCCRRHLREELFSNKSVFLWRNLCKYLTNNYMFLFLTSSLFRNVTCVSRFNSSNDVSGIFTSHFWCISLEKCFALALKG